MRLKVLILTSDQPRHLYFIKKISCHFYDYKVICESKKNYYDTDRNNSDKIESHFKNLKSNEEKWFPDLSKNNFDFTHVDDINEQKNILWASKEKFDVVCLFGTVILKKQWLITFPNKIVNLHLGLSPYYKGSATLFWPFANDELEFLGATIHLAIEKVDAGKILYRKRADFLKGDNYYDITFRLIKKTIDHFPIIISQFINGELYLVNQESLIRKIYKRSDFTEEELSNALKVIGSGLTVKKIKSINDKINVLINY